MQNILHYPARLFIISLVLMWLSARLGATLLRRFRKIEDEAREDFSVIQAATLTLLALIIGFTFSMAVGRYDQRKNYEEEEANAIGTEYIRAELLPAADAAMVRGLLKAYIEERVLFYTTRDEQELAKVNAETERLQDAMWSTVKQAATAQPTPIVALAVSGMNDVLNAQGYTQAAWWNRIPAAAWVLMMLIAMGANLLVGYGARGLKAGAGLLLIVPLLVSLSFTLIADIDSPRGGMIRVKPLNLHALADSMRRH
ncbi:bestrophin-like domain [Paraburkholderia aromaticivorans]|uniref:bestrophin-like domain n=1 Tax=Paraburkholderia aromaticivorans TaxID=2026199 RepID=UPI0038BCF789